MTSDVFFQIILGCDVVVIMIFVLLPLIKSLYLSFRIILSSSLVSTRVHLRNLNQSEFLKDACSEYQSIFSISLIILIVLFSHDMF